jgi:cysteine desulfurase/selenocysteine lyase
MQIAKATGAKLKYAGNQHHFPTPKTIISGVTQKTKIVAFADVSNLTGNFINSLEVVNGVRKINKNVIIVLDAAQSAAHIKFDLKKLDVDFMTTSSNKMLGSTGTGALYVNQRWLSKIKPTKFGGGMNAIITKDSFTLAAGPAKFEAGSINTIGIIS